MNTIDYESCWQRLCKLWPSWNTNQGLYEAWSRLFMPLSREAVMSAIDDHWEAAGAAFQPNPKEIKKLAAMNHHERRTPAEIEHIQRWERMNKLEQCDYAAYAYSVEAQRADGYEAERLRQKSATFADHARRLRALHGNDCPPNYGAGTFAGVKA